MRGFGSAPQAFVGVDVLVGDCGDFGGVVQETGDELSPCFGQFVLCAGFMEGVAVPFEQGEVGVHA